MGIFNKSKKKNESAVLPSFILLNDNIFDAVLFIKDFQEDWGIRLNSSDYSDKPSDNVPTLVTQVDDMTIALSLMPVPVPNGEAVTNAKTNMFWPEAQTVAEGHKAHVLIAVLGKSILETGTLQAKLCASCLRQPNAIAINTAGTVFKPDFYIGAAKAYIENGSFPIENHVFFGLYSSDGKTFSGYTYGLGNLGKMDIEILNSERDANEILDCMQNISSYIIESDVTLKHGETIGFTAEQKLSIVESKAVAIDGMTLKIQF